METLKNIDEAIRYDELVNDFEFAERLYGIGFLESRSTNNINNNLIWADFF